MDEMGKRMDELESNIGGLMNQAGLEPPNSAGAGVTPLNARSTMQSTGSIKASASATSSLPENKPKSISQRTSSSSNSVEI
jgi:hypothetical protein